MVYSLGSIGLIFRMSNTPSSHCRNCDHSLNSNYCPNCGQRNLDFRRDWRGLIGEYASSFLNIDGKITRGIIQLLFRPGLSTQLFLAGKRASQIPPLRLYLFASLMFFLWFTNQQGDLIFNSSDPEQTQAKIDYAQTEGQPEFAKEFAKKLENPAAVQATFNTWLPRVFLLGVPLLALASRILFFKREYVYLEHIIISMHLQTFLLLWIFLVGIFSNLVGLIHSPTGGLFWNVFIWWIQLYPVFALKRIFQLSWLKAIGTTIALEIVTFALFTFGMATVILISFWLA
ncbi:hypothetical protein VDG1235_1949 [Verrucomicrobiia bacterium DG1235]|nr:hypothetical protein VDG1235_1949 [Verrucomicrobiae bacterium DG1235]